MDMPNEIFESHKQVKRIPMTRQEYNDYRDWVLPSDENGDDAGYMVEYLDGGEPRAVTCPSYLDCPYSGSTIS
jgi:hypothetical protein